MYFRYIVLLALYQCLAVHAEYGLMKIESTVSTESVEICAASNSNNHKFSSSRFNKSWKLRHDTVNVYPDYGCSPTTSDYSDKIVIVNRGNCKFIDKLINVQNANGAGILIVSEDLVPSIAFTNSKTSITFAVINQKSFELYNDMLLKHGEENIRISEFKPIKASFMDPNALAMWLLAVFTVVLGGWFKISFNENTQQFETILPIQSDRIKGSASTVGDNMHQGLIFVVVMLCLILVTGILMYNFIFYVFVFWGYVVMTLYFFLMLVSFLQILLYYTRWRAIHNKPKLQLGLSWWHWFLFFTCVSFSVASVVYRNKLFAWIMQDLLALGFLSVSMKYTCLEDLKVSSVVLVGSVLLEMFALNYQFIFETFERYTNNTLDYAKNSENILNIAHIYKLPRFVSNSIDKCAELSNSFLGIYDILIPGMHIAACASWDYKLTKKTGVKTHSYYLSALVGYGVGLGICIANAVLSLSEPVLLYVVPCCLLSTVLVAVIRNELGDLWKGNINKPISETQIKKVITSNESDIRLV